MAFKLRNIKDVMSRKHGTGDYARGGKKFEQRMKPGESKFNYDVRMRKQGRNTPSTKPGSTKSTSTYQAPDPSTEISTGGPSYDWKTQERNPGDLRPVSRGHTESYLPPEPGDPFEYSFDTYSSGNQTISYRDTRKGSDAEWEILSPGEKGYKEIVKRYTGSETGDMSAWAKNPWKSDTYTVQSWTNPDGERNSVYGGSQGKGASESYLTYDQMMKLNNPTYKKK